jgi:hypothetical protein
MKEEKKGTSFFSLLSIIAQDKKEMRKHFIGG